jgi:hypothetical protein
MLRPLAAPIVRRKTLRSIAYFGKPALGGPHTAP